MTSDEIRLVIAEFDGHQVSQEASHRRVLWEIAYQLAVMNERQDVPKLKHNPFGESLGSPVGADSDKTVRDGVGVPMDLDDAPFPKAATLPPMQMYQAYCDAHGPVKVSPLTQSLINSVTPGALRLSCSVCNRELQFRKADERTTRSDPQTASIQPQPDSEGA